MVQVWRATSKRSVCVVVAVVALAGCSAGTQASRPAPAPVPTPASPASTSTSSGLPAIQDIESLGGQRLAVADADWIQVTKGGVWTTLPGGVLQRLDSITGAAAATVKLGDSDVSTAMDQGYGALWVAVATSPARLVRVDPTRGSIVASIKLPKAELQEEGSVGVGEGSVWVVVNRPGRTLMQVDPKRNRIVAAHQVPPGVVGARAGLGGVWLTDPEKGQLLRMDPRTAKVIATTQVGAGARFFAVGEGAVWVQNNHDATVSRVDPRTNKVVATIPVDDRPIDGGDLAVGGGFIWARVSGSLVSQIDPKTNTVVGRFGQAEGSGSVAADATAVWITAHDVDAAYRMPIAR